MQRCWRIAHATSVDLVTIFKLSPFISCHATPVPGYFNEAKLDFYGVKDLESRALSSETMGERRAQGRGEINKWKSGRRREKTEKNEIDSDGVGKHTKTWIDSHTDYESVHVF